MNVNYCAKSKSVEVLVDQIGQNTKKKKELFPHKMSCTHYLQWASRYWWKESKVILLGVFLSTTEIYIIITNILKTINSEEQ